MRYYDEVNRGNGDANSAGSRQGAERQASGRLRGRQAEAVVNDARVLDAAREVFAMTGLDAPVSLIAHRAGVGMGSLYRRYGSKEDLLRHLCMLSLHQMEADADAALENPRCGGWQTFEAYVRGCVSYRAGAFGAVAGYVPISPEMSQAAEDVHRKVQELVEHTQRTNALRSDVTAVDIHHLLELFSRSPMSVGDAAAESAPVAAVILGHDRLLTIALDGLRGDAATSSLPAATDWHTYRERWVAGGTQRPSQARW